MAAAKALTIVDRWEVGGGEREKEKGRARREKKMMHRKKKNEFRNGYLIQSLCMKQHKGGIKSLASSFI